jgi:murein DD-endopeptidase MepM/ murein hydrolase activator NlpD
MTSYFDHEYPLISATSLLEPLEASGSVIAYNSSKRRGDISYSRHDGYDWGKVAGAKLGDDVITAAPGCAKYRITSAGGNEIQVDHGNGFQTRYLHLLDNGLVTKSTTDCVNLTAKQKIGQVGSTGWHTTGPHVHFMVVQDKNKDGNFDDNIPDGLVDPFGWTGSDPDPWPLYSFFYNNEQRSGSRSIYLWEKALDKFSGQLIQPLVKMVVGKFTFQ